MSNVNVGDLDLGLLRALHALLHERHVTRAAQRIGLSQSAMSHSLQRLRLVFDDPLFVRSPRGVLPTPRAALLAEPVARVLGELERLLATPATFEPQRLARRFTLATSDYTDIVLLPRLLARLSQEAPLVDLDVRPMSLDLEAAIDEDRVDLALGVFPKLPARMMCQSLFADAFLCLLRHGHPATQQRLTLQRFAALPHLQIAPRGNPGGPVDDALAREGLTRRVVLRIGSFLAAPQIVAQSDLVLTAPERLVRYWTSLQPQAVTLLEPPLPLVRFHLQQVWHERRQQDPAHIFLRSLLAEVAQHL